MPATSLPPLTDKFILGELPRIAPWVFDEITAIGLDEGKSCHLEKWGKILKTPSS